MSEQLIRIPQYQYLYESLRQDIVKGIFKTGELLPSEKVLQNQYGLTQPTIRQALALLVQEGYIRKHQGKGSVVQSLPIGLGVVSLTAHLLPPDDTSPAACAPAAELITTTVLTKPTLRTFPEEFTFLPAERGP
ncbi:GntR family transcriptional regulator, partial [Hymenobacter terrenus]|uniref:GntR family transcriptional regulator n=1 Tax=Hymenobacter terrenus TaxID=1629124 RepID=UPI000AE165E6